jgi:hypothetical protein
MGLIEITEKGVFKLLSNLKVQKVAGPDLIPTQLLRELALIIAPMLTTLFLASIDQWHYTTRMERSKCGSNIQERGQVSCI